MKAILTAIGVFCAFVCSAHAATVTSSNGHHASVSGVFQPHAQCLINKLEHAGYRVDFMTGYASRSNPSAHPTGNAIDINQIAFGVVTRRLPSGFSQMADECGAYSGSHFGDTGHFEMRNKYGYVNLGGNYASHYRHNGHRARSYASAGISWWGASSPDFH